MDKRKIFNKNSVKRARIIAVQFGKHGSIAIDQTPSMKFNIDPSTGRPMTEIERLVRIQDSVAQQALFSQLREFKSQFLPADMTDEQAIMFQKSRHCQTKSELLAYRDGISRYNLQQELTAKTNAAREAKEKADRELFESYVNEIKSLKSKAD